MNSCTFVGDLNEDHLTNEDILGLGKLLSYLIYDASVRIFYTAATTQFDFICEKILDLFKKDLNDDIYIIRIAMPGDTSSHSNIVYDGVYDYDGDSFFNMCVEIVLNCDCTIYDNLKEPGLAMEVMRKANRICVAKKNLPPRHFDLNAVLQEFREIKKAQDGE